MALFLVIIGEGGFTSLNAVAHNGYLEVVQGLLDHGANVNTANDYGWTPLKTATLNGRMEVVRELMNHEANVHIAGKDGSTPLYSAGCNGHFGTKVAESWRSNR